MVNFLIWVLILAALLFWPVSKLVWVLSVRRLQRKLDKQLSRFLSDITSGMGRPERRRAMEWYLTGLLLDGGRKTVVGMASRLVDDEGEIEAMRQRLQQCVAVSTWADEELRRRSAMILERDLKPEAFVVDDTGFPKKGT